jgi:hypothetical protein
MKRLDAFLVDLVIGIVLWGLVILGIYCLTSCGGEDDELCEGWGMVCDIETCLVDDSYTCRDAFHALGNCAITTGCVALEVGACAAELQAYVTECGVEELPW